MRTVGVGVVWCWRVKMAIGVRTSSKNCGQRQATIQYELAHQARGGHGRLLRIRRQLAVLARSAEARRRVEAGALAQQDVRHAVLKGRVGVNGVFTGCEQGLGRPRLGAMKPARGFFRPDTKALVCPALGAKGR